MKLGFEAGIYFARKWLERKQQHRSSTIQGLKIIFLPWPPLRGSWFHVSCLQINVLTKEWARHRSLRGGTKNQYNWACFLSDCPGCCQAILYSKPRPKYFRPGLPYWAAGPIRAAQWTWSVHRNTNPENFIDLSSTYIFISIFSH